MRILLMISPNEVDDLPVGLGQRNPDRLGQNQGCGFVPLLRARKEAVATYSDHALPRPPMDHARVTLRQRDQSLDAKSLLIWRSGLPDIGKQKAINTLPDWPGDGRVFRIILKDHYGIAWLSPSRCRFITETPANQIENSHV